MKNIGIYIASTLLLFSTISSNAAFQQPPQKDSKAKKESKEAGSDIKQGTKKAGHGVSEGVDATGHAAKQGGKKAKKGIKHGAYDVSHNKATKKTNINEGNEKH